MTGFNDVHAYISLRRRVHELQDKCGALMAELRLVSHAADEAHERALYTVRAQVVIKEVLAGPLILCAQPCIMQCLLQKADPLGLLSLAAYEAWKLTRPAQ